MTKLAVILFVVLLVFVSAASSVPWTETLRTTVEDKAEDDLVTAELRTIAADLTDRTNALDAKIWNEISSIARNVPVPWIEPLRTVEDNVRRAIEDATSKAEDEFFTAQLKSTTIAADFADRATDFGARIWNEISSVTANVTAELKKFNSKARGACLKDCMSLTTRLAKIAMTAIKTTRGCINSKVNTGFQRVANVNRVANDAMVELEEIRVASRHCGENVDGPKCAAVAIVCSKAAARDATWVTVKSGPKLTAAWTKLKFLAVTFQPSLARCGSSEQLATFYDEASTVVERTARCIERKVQEGREKHRSNEKNVARQSELSL